MKTIHRIFQHSINDTDNCNNSLLCGFVSKTFHKILKPKNASRLYHKCVLSLENVFDRIVELVPLSHKPFLFYRHCVTNWAKQKPISNEKKMDFDHIVN